jgi:hypothetical protein
VLATVRRMAVAPWTAIDEGYLRAYQWAGALAGGAPLPQEQVPMPLGPGEIAHARFAPVALSGYFGEAAEYRKSFLLVGGPVGLAVTGAASYARNKAKEAEARRAAVPRWHQLGPAEVVATNQRLVLVGNGQGGSFWYAQTSPLQLGPGSGGVPAVQFQPADQPPLRLAMAFAPLLYVFVHRIVDGQAPGVPLPPGLLERAAAEGRL